MTVNFENETENKFGFDEEETLAKVIKACTDYMNVPYECEVNVLLTDEDSIHEMNMQYRGIDRPTDVLSFPMLSYEQAGDFEAFRDDPDAFDPESGELLLGDIVLCYNKIVAQAKEFGHSELREFSFLTAHSMLHLFGFDHMEDEERIEMERMQTEILDNIGITR